MAFDFINCITSFIFSLQTRVPAITLINYKSFSINW